MPFPVNVEIVHVWVLGSGNTGLAGNMSAATFNRYTTTTETAATESVTISEIGSTGSYIVRYTPENAELYRLQILESSLGFDTWFEDQVSDAPSEATAANAYCTEANVVGHVQSGDFTVSTIPTEVNVLRFMEDRAAMIYGWLVEVMGEAAPGPSGYDLTIDTSTDRGKALFRQCRLANSLSAAADVMDAMGMGDEPVRAERVSEMLQAAMDLKPVIQALATTAAGTDRARTHYDEGRVTKTPVTSRQEQGFVFDDRTQW